jgi:hypothetical protein
LPNNINEQGGVSDESTVTHLPEPPFFRATLAIIGGVRHARGPGARPENTSFEEERREVLASVLGALSGNPPDPDEMTACSYLLKHLSETTGRPDRHSAWPEPG